jgi:hypothetical protein
VKQNSLTNALTDCTESCGWCVNQCEDGEKYEVLVNCIRFQKEFLLVSKNINSMLGGRSTEMMKKILDLFKLLSVDIQKKQGDLNKAKLKTSVLSIEKWKLPGCSNIFEIALSLERLYLDGALDSD